MRRAMLGLVALAACVGILIACDVWTAWDDVFNRTSVTGHPRGWTGGDGAISVELPGNRALWLFGDSLITSYDSQARRPETATQLGHLAATAFGNTIAVQTDRTSPSASSVTLWARDANGAATSINDNVQAGMAMFFSNASMGLPGSSPQTLFTWPQGAECIGCSGASPRLLLAFAKFGATCDPHPGGPTNLSCIPTCSLSGGSDGPSCHSGVTFLSSVIARYKNIGVATPGDWQLDGTTLEVLQPNTTTVPIMWGTAFVDTGSGIWIFGRRIRTDLNPVTTDMVVVKAPTEVLTKSQWQFWNGSGWSTSYANSQVPVAKKVGSLNSVDKITRGTTTGYLLVHGDTDKLLYARVANAPSGTNPPTWADPSATTPRLDLQSVEFSLFYQVLDLINRGKCSPDLSGAVPNYSKCGLVYHGLGHAHLTMNDGSGQPWLVPASYVVPYGPNPMFNPALPEGPDNSRTGVVSTAYYRPKFAAIQLDKLKPWCTTNCWEGIVHDHAPRQVGSQSVTYAYDLQNSSRFYATLTRTTGAANMRIDFYNGLTFISGQTCPQDGSASVLTCNVSKPVTPVPATSVVVTVSGAASDTYGIRTHYAGFY